MAQQQRSRLTRQRYLVAGAWEIEKRGFAGASTPRIIAAANGSAGGYHHHFEDKMALGDAIIDAQLQFFDEAARQVAEQPAPRTTPRLQALIDLSFHYCTAIQEQVVLRAAVKLSTEAGPWMTMRSYSAPQKAVTRLLAAADEAGELLEGVIVEDAARFFVGGIAGLRITSYVATGLADLLVQISNMWKYTMPGVAEKGVCSRLRYHPPSSAKGD
ncbi:hypothetical protein VT50_0233320 [Streptomyces antioxidans]|uniref:Uncharacterized protein n=1 Tax=Streptomyces antioxidans TaxID=1507734 RepID=A0A1V4CW94_9ACTN|nr:TetR/AcrR family transcriptional regulator [Streptomyces antioxidans]OPF71597.1 hypothetical protein VT50_0233320 [Streptomyces antioxidans]